MINHRTSSRYIRLVTLICLAALLLRWDQTLLTGPGAVVAQSPSCPDLVKKALDSANQLCSGLKRNQACYGNALASANPKAGSTFSFSKPGDIIDLKDLQTLKLTAYDPAAGTWGVAIMRVQANLPDTAPGQNVTVILFGDAQVDDATRPGDNNKPMQAFYLRTGVGSPACKQVNQDGMLLKSPEGYQKVALTVNGVEMSVGSTVFLTAQLLPTEATPTGQKVAAVKIQIHTIKGSVTVTMNGQTKTVDEGMELDAYTTEDSEPVGELGDPQQDTTLDQEAIDALPVDELNQEDQQLTTNEDETATAEPGQEEITDTPEPGEEEITPTPEGSSDQPEVTTPPDTSGSDAGQPEATTPPDTSGSDTGQPDPTTAP